jgi:hypothetical protein
MLAQADAEALWPATMATGPIARPRQRQSDVILIRSHRVSSFRGLPPLPLCGTV